MNRFKDLKVKVKANIRSRLTAFILLAELFLNASLYFALKSDNELFTAVLVGLIVLGYLGLVWHK